MQNGAGLTLPLGGEPAGPARVRHHAVAEARSFVDDEVVLVAEQPADRDEHERGKQRDVEDQVAGLAAVALLGRQGEPATVLVPRHHPPAAPEYRAGRRRRLVRRCRGRELTGLRQPVEVVGAGSGLARMALACRRIRGTRQPTSETNSSR